MLILGISPLDKDATASLVADGKVLFAAGEERFSRQKQHAGFPARAIEAALDFTGARPEEVDLVAYPFLGWREEVALIRRSFDAERRFLGSFRAGGLSARLREAQQQIPRRDGQTIHGLDRPDQRVEKSPLKQMAYRLAGVTPVVSNRAAAMAARAWARKAAREHRHWHRELEEGLSRFGLGGKLKRFEHHLSHAANAYHASGYDRALIVTLDGYGSGLAGSVSLGEGDSISRLSNIRFPHSLGNYYESVTSSLGFNPNRHAGKIVGLAAYGDASVLEEVLLERFDTTKPGDYRIHENLNLFFSRHLASEFPMVDIAAAYQRVLEVVACKVVRHWLEQTGCSSVVLSGGVAANVKMNQRIYELDGVERLFVYPNMGDGGCGTGIAMLQSWPGGVGEPLRDVFLGPEYSEQEIRQELDQADLAYDRPKDLAATVAAAVQAGKVVARFSGRMEYGPRALGNRSILYHAREPEVNHWLNQRLGRTEFMPFAPVTLWEERHRCYHGCSGAEHSAEFMTITFDCSDEMKETCPAAVHVDGTARPQLIRRDVNAEYYDIVKEYYKLSGIPSLINTSFNMHEEPIVCSPRDAVRAFVRGHLDALAIGPYFANAPKVSSPQDVGGRALAAKSVAD